MSVWVSLSFIRDDENENIYFVDENFDAEDSLENIVKTSLSGFEDEFKADIAEYKNNKEKYVLAKLADGNFTIAGINTKQGRKLHK